MFKISTVLLHYLIDFWVLLSGLLPCRFLSLYISPALFLQIFRTFSLSLEFWNFTALWFDVAHHKPLAWRNSFCPINLCLLVLGIFLLLYLGKPPIFTLLIVWISNFVQALNLLHWFSNFFFFFTIYLFFICLFSVFYHISILYLLVNSICLISAILIYKYLFLFLLSTFII